VVIVKLVALLVVTVGAIAGVVNDTIEPQTQCHSCLLTIAQ
jgi:hypothetical protein